METIQPFTDTLSPALETTKPVSDTLTPSPQMGAAPAYQSALPMPNPTWETGLAAPVNAQQIGVQQGTPEAALGATLVGSSPNDSVGTEQVPVRTGILSNTRSIEANLSLIGAGVAALDLLLAEAKGLLDRMPQSFPSGPVPAGSSSSSSSSSGGGSGFQLLGDLALLSILLLGGKHLWSTREFLKPSSALLAIIERPG